MNHWERKVTTREHGQLRTRPYKYAYEYKTHSDDPRIPDEEGWRIAVWPNGEALSCHPLTNPAVHYALAFSSYDVALENLLETYEDNQ